jgi:hypothetical protein
MDWRRCTPEWSHRRRHRHCGRLVSFLASDVIRHARNDCFSTSTRPKKDYGFQRSLCPKQAPHFCLTEAHAVSS